MRNVRERERDRAMSSIQADGGRASSSLSGGRLLEHVVPQIEHRELIVDEDRLLGGTRGDSSTGPPSVGSLSVA